MSLKEILPIEDAASSGLSMRPAAFDEVDAGGVFKVTCRAADGSLRWEEETHNLVVTVGKNDLLDKYFLASAYTAAFFVGLKSTGTILATDNMTAHPGWTDITPYSNAARPSYLPAAASAGAASNSASPASFTIDATATVAGCFITTSSTKGGTAGILFSAANFAASREVLSGDTLNVVYSISC